MSTKSKETTTSKRTARAGLGVNLIDRKKNGPVVTVSRPKALAPTHGVVHHTGERNIGPGTYTTVTAKYQTTVPAYVRNAIGAQPGSKLNWSFEGGRAFVEVAPEETRDPAVDAYLHFLEKDMIENPGNIQPMPMYLLDIAQRLIDGEILDIDEVL